MSSLSNSVYAYYLRSLNTIPPEKRFHFTSRLYLWDQDPACRQILTDLRAWFTDNEQPLQAVSRAIKIQAVQTKNAAALREQYFGKYAELRSYNNALFRINFLQTIYGLDARQVFDELFGSETPYVLFQTLYKDHGAIRMLSTHAVNFFYLYSSLILRKPNAVQPDNLLVIGRQGYNTSDLVHIQLRIYLYTHCIIGATQFYYQPVPEAEKGTYCAMIDELETLIDKRFADVNLDNKFEFLTCCKLVGRNSHLESRIFAEAEMSLSDQGTFLIDRHNNNPQRDNSDLDKSEHRNVLFILAHRAYSPTAAAR